MIPKYILDEMDTEIMVYRVSDEKLVEKKASIRMKFREANMRSKAKYLDHGRTLSCSIVSDEKLAAMVKQIEKPTGLWARFWKWVAA